MSFYDIVREVAGRLPDPPQYTVRDVHEGKHALKPGDTFHVPGVRNTKNPSYPQVFVFVDYGHVLPAADWERAGGMNSA